MSLGKSRSRSTPSTVWEGQVPYLTNIYNQGQNILGRSVGGQAVNQANQVASQTYQPWQQMTQGGQSATFQNNPNLTGFASGNIQNEALQGAINAGVGDITRNFTQNLLPSIKADAVSSGTSGGSRQGIAEGLAISDTNRQVSDFVSRMLSDNFGQMMNQRLQAIGIQGTAAGAADQVTGQAVSMAPNMMNLGFMPEQAFWANQFAPLRQYADIVGGPTVLSGSSSGSGWNVGLPTKRSG